MTPAERAARERKQKIFVVVGGLLLVGLLAIEVPKMLGGSSSASSSPSSTTQDTTTVVSGGTSSGVSRSLVAQTGLTSFSRFGGKDPFVQQVKFSDAPSSSGSTTGKSGGGKSSKGNKSTSKPSTKEFTLGAQPAASMTVISVNGARQALSAGSRFPAADPVFVLVSEDQKKKTVVVGVAGGAYASGSRTTKLAVGKPLVLVNTTTGARYRLVLVAVGSGEAAPAKSGAKSGGSAAPSTQSTSPSTP